MSDISRRIARLEEHLEDVACICSEGDRELAIVVIGSGWGAEEIERALAAAQVDCPSHGLRSPNILRIGEKDAKL
jgi:hypothetical protein